MTYFDYKFAETARIASNDKRSQYDLQTKLAEANLRLSRVVVAAHHGNPQPDKTIDLCAELLVYTIAVLFGDKQAMSQISMYTVLDKLDKALSEQLREYLHSAVSVPVVTAQPVHTINPIAAAVTSPEARTQSWPFPTKPGVMPPPTTPAPPLKKPVIITSKPKTPQEQAKNLPKVHVVVRKHPTGVPQPLGERRVFRMRQAPGTDMIQVGIGDGTHGWTLDLTKATPSFLTFRINGTKDAKTLQEAWAFWKAKSMTS